MVPSEVFSDREKAWLFVEQMKQPAAMKIDAAEIWHRTESDGVFLNISCREEFNRAWDKMTEGREIRGVIVQKMCPGVELALGARRDVQFGPVVMFGLGGIFVELMDDVVFRIAPFDLAEAKKMIGEIKGHRLLTGFRGKPAVDQDKLAQILVNLGYLMAEQSEIEEIDLNPVMASGNRIEAVDAKIWILAHEE